VFSGFPGWLQWLVAFLLIPMIGVIVKGVGYFFKLEKRLQRIEFCLNLIAERLGINLNRYQK